MDDDPTRNPDGTLAEKWSCPDCKTHVHLHSDPDHASHDWTRDFVREHRYVHDQVLHAEHNGDRGSLRLALKYPAHHAAIVEIHGPIANLTPDHRRQLMAAAGIDDPLNPQGSTT